MQWEITLHFPKDDPFNRSNKSRLTVDVPLPVANEIPASWPERLRGSPDPHWKRAKAAREGYQVVRGWLSILPKAGRATPPRTLRASWSASQQGRWEMSARRFLATNHQTV